MGIFPDNQVPIYGKKREAVEEMESELRLLHLANLVFFINQNLQQLNELIVFKIIYGLNGIIAIKMEKRYSLKPRMAIVYF